MGRKRYIPKDADPTTISLTRRQQIAFQKLQIKRQEDGQRKPTLTGVMTEGFQILLSREGWSEVELALIFPKPELRQAPVEVISRRKKR
jgi:hypothetical protein